MDAINAIETLRAFEDRINGLVAKVNSAAHDAQSQWAALGRIGGQREDHAALMLGRVVAPALRELERFCGAALEQIAANLADPFSESA